MQKLGDASGGLHATFGMKIAPVVAENKHRPIWGWSIVNSGQTYSIWLSIITVTKTHHWLCSCASLQLSALFTAPVAIASNCFLSVIFLFLFLAIGRLALSSCFSTNIFLAMHHHHQHTHQFKFKFKYNTSVPSSHLFLNVSKCVSNNPRGWLY
jgi:hypothetical protein